MAIASVVFLTSGTWTCPSNVYFVDVEGFGGGGGGGAGSAADDATPALGADGGGGGGGALQKKLRVSVVPGTTYNITIGAGGTAGIWLGANGGAGGDTTFDTLATFHGASGAANGVLTALAIGAASYKGFSGASVSYRDSNFSTGASSKITCPALGGAVDDAGFDNIFGYGSFTGGGPGTSGMSVFDESIGTIAGGAGGGGGGAGPAGSGGNGGDGGDASDGGSAGSGGGGAPGAANSGAGGGGGGGAGNGANGGTDGNGGDGGNGGSGKLIIYFEQGS